MSISERVILEDGVSGPARQAGAAVRALVRALSQLEGANVNPRIAGQVAQIRDSARMGGRLQVDQQRIAGRMDLERQRQAHRRELIQIREEGRERVRVQRLVDRERARAQRRTGPSAGASGGPSPFAFGAAAIAADLAIGAVKAAVAMAVQGVRVVANAEAFKESTLSAMKILLKSEGEAKRIFALGVKLAAELGQDPQDSLANLQNLLARGFKAEGATGALEVIKAMADLKVISPSADIGNVTKAIAQIKAKGKLQLEELQNQLGEQFDVGAVIDQLAKKLGKTNDEIRKMIKAGQIDADTGVLAILDAIKEKTGKPLGDAAKEASRSIGGLIERLLNFPKTLLFAADNTKAAKLFKDTLAGILKALDPTSASGKRLVGIVERLVSAMSKFFAAATGGKDLAQSFDRIVTGLEAVASGVEKAAPAVGKFVSGLATGLSQGAAALGTIASTIDKAFGGERGKTMSAIGTALEYIGIALGYVVTAIVGFAAIVYALVFGPLLALAAGIGAIVELIVGLVDTFSAAGSEMGAGLVNGLVSAISGGASSVVSSIVQMATSAISAAKAAFGISSPSKVFEWIGTMLTGGTVRGVERGTPSVAYAVQGMTASASQAANTNGPANAPAYAGSAVAAPATTTAPGFGGGKGGNTYYFNVAMHGSGSTKEDAQILWDEFRRMVEAA